MVYNNYTHNLDAYKGTMRHTSTMFDVKSDQQIAQVEEAKQIATDSMRKLMAEMRTRNATKKSSPQFKSVVKTVAKPVKSFMFK